MSFELFRTASNTALPGTLLKEERETILRFGTQLLDAGEAARRASLIAATLPMPASPLTVPRPAPRDPAAAEAALVEEDEPFLVEEPEAGTASAKGGRRKSTASTNPRRNVIEGALAGAALPESPRTIIAAGTLDDGGFRAVSFSAGATLAATSLAGAMLSVAVAQTPQEAARLEMAGSFLATWKATQDFLAEGVQGRVMHGSALMPLEEIALAAPPRGAPATLTVSGAEVMPGAGALTAAAPAVRLEETFEFSPRRPAAGEALQVDTLARDRDPISGRSAEPAPATPEPQGAAPVTGTPTQGVMAPAVPLAPPVSIGTVEPAAPTVVAPAAEARSSLAAAGDLPGNGAARTSESVFSLPIPDAMPAVVVVARPRPEPPPPNLPPAAAATPESPPVPPEPAATETRPAAAVPVVAEVREKVAEKLEPPATRPDAVDSTREPAVEVPEGLPRPDVAPEPVSAEVLPLPAIVPAVLDEVLP
ncbi:hypothetical protein ACFHPP_25955, partial [Falsiroseomonas sp. E2-1-a20]